MQHFLIRKVSQQWYNTQSCIHLACQTGCWQSPKHHTQRTTNLH